MYCYLAKIWLVKLSSYTTTLSHHNAVLTFLIARAILVDLSPPLDSASCNSIQESLSNTLTLVHHLLGPQRIPLITITILGNYPEVVKICPSAELSFPWITPPTIIQKMHIYSTKLWTHYTHYTIINFKPNYSSCQCWSYQIFVLMCSLQDISTLNTISMDHEMMSIALISFKLNFDLIFQ